MKDNRDILEKLAWLANDMEYMEAPTLPGTPPALAPGDGEARP